MAELFSHQDFQQSMYVGQTHKKLDVMVVDTSFRDHSTSAHLVFTGIGGGRQNHWELRIRALRLLLARMSILDRTRHTGRGKIL